MYARWGASKFTKHQFRAVGDNNVREQVEPPALVGDGGVIALDKFMQMIEPIMPKDATKSDMDALLKRATWIVNTDDFIYVRIAGSGDRPVRRHSNQGSALTSDGGRHG